MLHSFSLFRIANMLENWHQMDGNWLETIKHIYIARMRFLPFLWFSMKLGMINSFLVMCFATVQKYSNQKIFTKFLQKYHIMAIKQCLGRNALLLQLIQEKICQLFFSHDFDRLSIYDIKVDQISADYNGYYRQEYGKSDKYGFSGACLRTFHEVRCVFKILHKISNFRLIFASKFQI